MSMSREDYRAVAEVLRSNLISAPEGAIEDHMNAIVNNIACQLAIVFAEDNPRFDTERFLLAVSHVGSAS